MKDFKDTTDGVKSFLSQIPLFTGLKDSSLESLALSCKLIKVEKGQFIFYQSDIADSCFIVKTGLVSIQLESYDGREMVINEMYPGDFFGEVGLLTDRSRSTSAVAYSETELLTFPRQVVLTLIEAEPLLARRLLEIMAIRLRSSSERESALAFLDAQARLARLLLQIEKLAPNRGYVTVSQEELAQRTGLTRQTVAKILGRWRRAGWLITGRGRIMILKKAEFSKLEKEWLLK